MQIFHPAANLLLINRILFQVKKNCIKGKIYTRSHAPAWECRKRNCFKGKISLNLIGIWRHRLAVRTPASHAGSRGSIPLGATTKITKACDAFPDANSQAFFLHLRDLPAIRISCLSKIFNQLHSSIISVFLRVCDCFRDASGFPADFSETFNAGFSLAGN